jgi:CheY-like chemotaxis protein
MKYSPIILIVDDDPDILDMYQEVLQIEGVVTSIASSGSEALLYCQNHPGVQVIISDAHMGEMSGVELLGHLKKHYETLPVFYLLTGAFDVNERDIKAQGAREVFLKPFDLNEILERIKKDIKF